MSESLVFKMGEFEAIFPTDRCYAKNHLWAESRNGCIRFGFSAYAVRLLQDVYFLEWNFDEGEALAEKQEIGFVESKKAESSLYSPASGRLKSINNELLTDPSAINIDLYRAGWLFEMETPGETFLSPKEYIEHLKAVWVVTQKTIKGQMNK